MAKAALYSAAGVKQSGDITLDKAVFGLAPNAELLTLAYNAYLSNGRSAHPNTLTRGLVRGGGRKPWRQKGTGRARVGSIRVPEWKGGGVVFGPTGIENHTVKLPIKMKRLALRQALSVQASEGLVTVMSDFKPKDGKTKATVELLSKLKLSGRILVVLEHKDELVERATRNVAGLVAAAATYLNVFDILNADQIVVTEKALEAIGQWLAVTEKATLKAAAPAETKPATTKAATKPATKPAAKTVTK